mmetsp:Transcript_39581/g.93978  ORF Transcript_39581/g.93978 Transcript_39581/m.93978 type:complete len:357 (+) Transcript_39581:408-1478(+)
MTGGPFRRARVGRRPGARAAPCRGPCSGRPRGLPLQVHHQGRRGEPRGPGEHHERHHRAGRGGGSGARSCGALPRRQAGTPLRCGGACVRWPLPLDQRGVGRVHGEELPGLLQEPLLVLVAVHVPAELDPVPPAEGHSPRHVEGVRRAEAPGLGQQRRTHLCLCPTTCLPLLALLHLLSTLVLFLEEELNPGQQAGRGIPLQLLNRRLPRLPFVGVSPGMDGSLNRSEALCVTRRGAPWAATRDGAEERHLEGFGAARCRQVDHRGVPSGEPPAEHRPGGHDSLLLQNCHPLQQSPHSARLAPSRQRDVHCNAAGNARNAARITIRGGALRPFQARRAWKKGVGPSRAPPIRSSVG